MTPPSTTREDVEALAKRLKRDIDWRPDSLCEQAAATLRALLDERDVARAEVERLQGLFRSVAPVVNHATWTKSTRPLADELHAIIRAALAGAPSHD